MDSGLTLPYQCDFRCHNRDTHHALKLCWFVLSKLGQGGISGPFPLTVWPDKVELPGCAFTQSIQIAHALDLLHCSQEVLCLLFVCEVARDLAKAIRISRHKGEHDADLPQVS